jgi:hypothetical protein
MWWFWAFYGVMGLIFSVGHFCNQWCAFRRIVPQLVVTSAAGLFWPITMTWTIWELVEHYKDECDCAAGWGGPNPPEG